MMGLKDATTVGGPGGRATSTTESSPLEVVMDGVVPIQACVHMSQRALSASFAFCNDSSSELLDLWDA